MASDVQQDVLTDIATLKAEVFRLDKNNERLTLTLDAISKELAELKISFEGVKTRLSLAIGVAVFLVGAVSPILVKSFAVPAPDGESSEVRSLQKQMDRLELRLEQLLTASQDSKRSAPQR